jgi:hypothetical protein
MANVTITNTTLVDTCNFPSIRFGRYYTGRLPNATVDNGGTHVPQEFIGPNSVIGRDTVVNPGPTTTTTTQNNTTARPTGYSEEVTATGETVINCLVEGLPSVVANDDVLRNTVSGTRVIQNSYIEGQPPFCTSIEDGVDRGAGRATATVVTSNFGGIASDVNVTRTRTGATVIGKSCGPA